MSGVQCTHSPTLRINLVKGGEVSACGDRDETDLRLLTEGSEPSF